VDVALALVPVDVALALVPVDVALALVPVDVALALVLALEQDLGLDVRHRPVPDLEPEPVPDLDVLHLDRPRDPSLGLPRTHFERAQHPILLRTSRSTR
jgi:hypothetical protein